MTLEEAELELERIDNELDFWRKRKFEIETLAMPKATKYDDVKVDGGKRTDTMLKVVELQDKYKVDEHIKYLEDLKEHLQTWMNKELEIIRLHGDIAYEIVFLKDIKTKIGMNGKRRKLKWREIAEITNYSERNCQYIYESFQKSGPNRGPKNIETQKNR